MSYTITTDIFCDGEGCDQWVAGPAGQAVDREGAKKVAKRAGWRLGKREHFCPRCKDRDQ